MDNQADEKFHVIDRDNLPPHFPTHIQTAGFWEALGRVVATFGFLEQQLAIAIFAFTGQKQIPEDQFEDEFNKWIETLQRALSDPLGGLIDAYGKAVRDNSQGKIANLDNLIEQLREASRLRNVLCHGSWQNPDSGGRSIPFFVNKKIERFETPIDFGFLEQCQKAVMELAVDVIDTVSRMGWQHPGSGGPGKPLVAAKELGG